MDKELQKFFQNTKKIKLDKKEQFVSRAELINFIEKSSISPVRYLGLFRPIFRIKKHMAISAFILAILLTSSGGVIVAAENSLPGSPFYPVKTQGIENIQLLFANSTNAKAETELKLTEKRLEEAEKLTIKGKLNATTRARIEQIFIAHAEKVRNLIAKLEEQGNIQAATTLSSQLELILIVHSQILAQLETENPESKKEASIFSGKITGEKETATRLKVQIEQKTTGNAQANTRSAAEGILNAAENKIREAETFISRSKARLGAEATANAEARLELAKNVAVQARAEIGKEAFNEAFIHAGEAHRIAQESKMLVELTAKNIQIESIKGVEVEKENNSNKENNEQKKDTNQVESHGNDNETKGTIQSETKLELELKTPGLFD